MENKWNLTHNRGIYQEKKHTKLSIFFILSKFTVIHRNAREFIQFKKKNNNHNYYLNTHENPQEFIKLTGIKKIHKIHKNWQVFIRIHENHRIVVEKFMEFTGIHQILLFYVCVWGPFNWRRSEFGCVTSAFPIFPHSKWNCACVFHR